ncbi:hypothetical protein [uncultured Acetobacteroides sp.]|uniref:hypothetical protein n=1 Tax=uncultured Acetobacteroides sp. TaxID=1760811 RepID=UPI0029F47DD6|nr:hypothetical protein [uncultured Acetobacteroides sp.]
MFALRRCRRTLPYGLKDVEFYLYLLVFVLSYLLLKEILTCLPGGCSYFYPQLVAVIVGTIFFGFEFGLINAVAPPLLFFFFIGADTSFLELELTREVLVFILVVAALVFRRITPKFWNFFILIVIAEVGAMLVLLVAGGEFLILLKQAVFLLPGMALGSLLSLALLKALCAIESRSIDQCRRK